MNDGIDHSEKVEVIVLDQKKIATQIAIDAVELQFLVERDNWHDIVTMRMLQRLTASFYERVTATHTFVRELERPRFLDWLLGRKPVATIKIDLAEVLKESPPVNDRFIRMVNWEPTPISIVTKKGNK